MAPASSVATQPLLPLRILTLLALVSFLTSFPWSHRKIRGSICLDEGSNSDTNCCRVEYGYNGPQTPSTSSDNHLDNETEIQPQRYGQDSDESDNEYGGSTQVAPRKKKGNYDSRIEQILYENPELPILIVDAGKSSESGGKYIVYTIRTGVSSSVYICNMGSQ
jgi:hypothetical protein